MSSALEFLNQYPMIETAIGIVAVMMVAYLADRISKRIILATINRIVRKTAFKFDDVLLEFNVFGRVAHLAPALAVYFGIQLVPDVPEAIDTLVQRAAAASMALIGVSALAAFLTAVGKIYATSSIGPGQANRGLCSDYQDRHLRPRWRPFRCHPNRAVPAAPVERDRCDYGRPAPGFPGHDSLVCRQPADGQRRQGPRRGLDRDAAVRGGWRCR